MTKFVALLHPGNMGVTIGTAVQENGATVAYVPSQRSVETRQRAANAGFTAFESLPELLAASGLVISVCPPGVALKLAQAIAATGYAGDFLDANAIAPASAMQVRATVEKTGARYIDGGIIGPPALTRGTTRLYLSGPAAANLLPYFAAGFVEAIEIGADPTAASALKMAYAAWTKGSSALLLACAALSRRNGVEQALIEEWSRSIPGLHEHLQASAVRDAPKAWRFVGEMQEISQSFSAAGLPADFHQGAAAIFSMLAQYKDAPADLDEVLQTLTKT